MVGESGNRIAMIIDEWDALIRENPDISQQYLRAKSSLWESTTTRRARPIAARCNACQVLILDVPVRQSPIALVLPVSACLRFFRKQVDKTIEFRLHGCYNVIGSKSTRRLNFGVKHAD